jgi:hypothetical protein
MNLRRSVLLLLSALNGCGGSDQIYISPRTDYELAVMAADAKRAEVKTLAVDSPCTQSDHCSVIKLQPTYFEPCGLTEDIDYSLISATASQARTATAQHTELARAAQALAPRPPGVTSCTGFTLFRPLVCVGGRCQH